MHNTYQNNRPSRLPLNNFLINLKFYQVRFWYTKKYMKIIFKSIHLGFYLNQPILQCFWLINISGWLFYEIFFIFLCFLYMELIGFNENMSRDPWISTTFWNIDLNNAIMIETLSTVQPWPSWSCGNVTAVIDLPPSLHKILSCAPN